MLYQPLGVTLTHVNVTPYGFTQPNSQGKRHWSQLCFLLRTLRGTFSTGRCTYPTYLAVTNRSFTADLVSIQRFHWQESIATSISDNKTIWVLHLHGSLRLFNKLFWCELYYLLNWHQVDFYLNCSLARSLKEVFCRGVFWGSKVISVSSHKSQVYCVTWQILWWAFFSDHQCFLFCKFFLVRAPYVFSEKNGLKFKNWPSIIPIIDWFLIRPDQAVDRIH
jgi:hypothetical protein